MATSKKLLTKLQKLGQGEQHRTPPKEYREEGATSPADYADPKRLKYPLHTEENVRNAIARFGQFGADYSVDERKAIAKRILAAARKYDITVDPSTLVGKLSETGSSTRSDRVRRMSDMLKLRGK